MIQVATKASKRLRGKATKRSPGGRTFRFHITTHIRAKPTNQDRRVVSRRANLLEIM
jgi:hypothetical protein